MTVFGYARVSTRDQDLGAQIAELEAAGCDKIFREKASGAKSDRVELGKLLGKLEAGDVLMAIKEGAFKPEDLIADLHELVSLKKPGRESEREITVFKSVGCALEDLVAAELLL